MSRVNGGRMARSGAAGRGLLLSLGFAAAVTVAAAGLGLGVPHLRKEGLGLVGLLGVVMLLAGLAGAGVAGWWLLAGLRRRWWLPLLPALLVVTYLAFWTVGQGVAAGLPPRPALGERTPADVGLAYDDVRVPTAEGDELAGWWIPSRDGGAIVVLHGAGSTRTAVLDQAAVLAEAGWGVLLVDARGHGDSEGSGMDFGWWGESDVEAALDFVTAQPGVSGGRVGLVGLSMGGEEAIGAAGIDDRVGAVVAEGATTRVAADKEYLVDRFGVRGRLQVAIDHLTYGVAGLVSDAPRPRPLRDSVVEAAGHGVRFLLVAAGEVAEEGWAAERLQRAAPDAVEVWTVAGADHVGGLDEDPDEWAARVLGFLDEALDVRGAAGM